MKKYWISILAICFIAFGLIKTRIYYSPSGNGYEVKVTTYDALGYYMYLPGIIIYEDVTQLDWLFEIENNYHVMGTENPYQIHKHDNGNYVFKYFGGVAILELPFFLIGHQIALNTDFPPDGFSPPYQYSIAFGNVFYAIISLLILRLVLLRYFNDKVVAVTLLLSILGTNIIQYISIDSGQSHGFIFPLYSIILYATMKWHESPKLKWAVLSGLVIGLATIARPTEAIMVLIPLLWGTQNKESAKEKWSLVKSHMSHAYIAAFFGVVGILPQLIYWKYASGSWIFDVGSKWTFLNPFFRVLVGFEKGWFIYTPITILFVVGMFFIKKFPFRKSVLWFGLLNIYIIISWFDWRYGGSYSTRALSQATPVYALPLAAFVNHIFQTKWKWVFSMAGAYFIALNLFQIYQYNLGVLHYDHMNARYYKAIYWDSQPSPLECSLLDTKDYLWSTEGFSKKTLESISEQMISTPAGGYQYFLEIPVDEMTFKNNKTWIHVRSNAQLTSGFWNTYFKVEVISDSLVKESKIRFFRPRAAPGSFNDYEFFVEFEKPIASCFVRVSVGGEGQAQGKLSSLSIDNLFEK